ncbi:hypothetical protein FH972_022888 [Carpinus fangiana]|uniref:Altered inheritance of mitochondria protein 24, mitochondrial n=1 Tax=Carpinus fangiana TaxID=176857 RepID=A0A5N6KU34_9ROSI|nr:hypothetical protein FH972_022888 [Carpinus fangiana]
MSRQATRLLQHGRCSTISSCTTFRRSLQIQATPSTTAPSLTGITTPASSSTSTSTPSARFEVLGSGPSSLLHVALSASQPLYTRRGSLIALHGSSNPSDAVSTLSPLAPWLRAPLGVPFLYQSVTSASPISLLVGTRSPSTTFAVLNMDGREDWVVASRKGLVAWCGERLTVSPRLSTSLGVAHWGQQTITGRGLVALAGTGGVYSVVLAQGEQYIAAPANVLAYSAGSGGNINRPEPYRLRSTTLRLAVPNLVGMLPVTRFTTAMRDTETYRFFMKMAFRIRTWARRSLWGDRLFIRFTGPGTVLVQSRPGKLVDVLDEREINEVMDSPADGLVQAERARIKEGSEQETVLRPAPKIREASVKRDGTVKID